MHRRSGPEGHLPLMKQACEVVSRITGAYQVDYDPGIEIAAPRVHHQSLQWRIAH